MCPWLFGNEFDLGFPIGHSLLEYLSGGKQGRPSTIHLHCGRKVNKPLVQSEKRWSVYGIETQQRMEGTSLVAHTQNAKAGVHSIDGASCAFIPVFVDRRSGYGIAL